MAPKAQFYGMNPPFFAGPSNILSLQTDERLIKNDLLQLILTIPGERIYRPDFGTLVRAIVFENLADTDLGAIETNIITAINKYEERVTVNNVTASLDISGNQLNITIDTSPNGDPLTHYLIELGIGPGGQILFTR